jgi:hypothetical protein
MAPVTTRHRPKPFTWSYSRLKNFESCPKKHWHVDIAKDIKEDESQALAEGYRVHDAFAKRLGDKRKPLPDDLQKFEKYCAKLEASPGDIHVENKLALTRDFGACGFFDGSVWFRAVGDVIKVHGDVALIVDWKTGRIVEDSVQLALSAACVFAKYPEVKKIRSRFVWLKEDAQTDEDFAPDDMPAMWKSLWPRIEALERAHNMTEYPARESGLCRNWCPVRSCPFNGANV